MAIGKHTGNILDDRYRLLDIIGEGGMGTVYLAEHQKLGRKVAVKFLHLALAQSGDVLMRFHREAKAATAIEHPNIIDVFDVGLSPWEEPYMVMEYLKGENLAGLIKKRAPMSVDCALVIIRELLDGLAAAHEAGIIHRDLKPENVFLIKRPDDSLGVKIIDFGISKFTANMEQANLTRTGSMLGTPMYMSPEQARGRGNVDHRADLYAVGVILFEMLTRKLPFSGESCNDFLVNILTEDAKKPSVYLPEISLSIEEFIMRAIAKKPATRFASAAEMKRAVENLFDGTIEDSEILALLPDESVADYATGSLGTTVSGDPFSAPTVLSNGDAREVDRPLSTEETEDAKQVRALEQVKGLEQVGDSKTLSERSQKAQFLIIAAAVLLAGGVFVFLWSGFPHFLSTGDDTSVQATLIELKKEIKDLEKDSAGEEEVLRLQAKIKKMERESAALEQQYEKKLQDELSAQAAANEKAVENHNNQPQAAIVENQIFQGSAGDKPQELFQVQSGQGKPDKKSAEPIEKSSAGNMLSGKETTGVGSDTQLGAVQSKVSKPEKDVQTQATSDVQPKKEVVSGKKADSISGNGDNALQGKTSVQASEPGQIESVSTKSTPTTSTTADKIEPLTPALANRHLDKKRYLVKACHDKTDAEKEGELVIVVSIFAEKIKTSVTKNDLSQQLAQCVSSVISAQKFKYPINQPVMFEKTYQFKN